MADDIDTMARPGAQWWTGGVRHRSAQMAGEGLRLGPDQDEAEPTHPDPLWYDRTENETWSAGTLLVVLAMALLMAAAPLVRLFWLLARGFNRLSDRQTAA